MKLENKHKIPSFIRSALQQMAAIVPGSTHRLSLSVYVLGKVVFVGRVAIT